MKTGDVLTDALNYALNQIEGFKTPVAVLNACGLEDKSFVKQSDHACYNFLNTLNGVFNTILVRATRQSDETLGIIATACTHAAANGIVVVAQENAHGAEALEKRLKKAFSDVRTIIKHKCRVMVLNAQLADKTVLNDWQSGAVLQMVAETGLWSTPGLFSWNRVDPASKLLLAHLPETLKGAGADLGCGYGFLSTQLVQKKGVSTLYALDIDCRAVEACTRNLQASETDIPFHVLWRDVTATPKDVPRLDWIVMNPPFHTQQREDRELGQKFCLSALKMLKPRGSLYLVANRHMPYEILFEKTAHKVTCLIDQNGFKILYVQAK
jgi:16S rRNA (guanine1207-N2)-methyltransferase